MRTTLITGLVVALATGACADESDADAGEAAVADRTAEADVPTEVEESALDRWDVSLDQEDAGGDFQMVEEDGAWRIRTGPAGIAWRASDLVEEGDFTARATFEQRGAQPGHREAYGLLVGGFHLESPDQRYTYFLVRGTGDYLVKQRDGEETRTLTDWTGSDAVRAILRPGDEPRNTLEVRVQGDSVRFAVNDRVVETLPADRARPYGLAGLRVNHGLDVEVSDFEVVRSTGPSGEAGQAGGG